jgi:hypothetical protein
MSEDITPRFTANIAKALVQISSKLESVSKTKTNPAFRSKYAPLDEILGSIKPTLAECGCAVVFIQIPQEDLSAVVVETVIIHESGDYVSGKFAAKTVKNDAQGVAGAISYLKRYGVTALLALETDEDDDGNTAVGNVNSAPARQPQPTPAVARTTSAPAKLPTGNNSDPFAI